MTTGSSDTATLITVVEDDPAIAEVQPEALGEVGGEARGETSSSRGSTTTSIYEGECHSHR
jgi:hypothetical protein